MNSLLRPHQQTAVAHLLTVLALNGAALDGSDTGTGKTYVATAIAATLNVPTLVVVPKIAVTAWSRCAETFGTRFSILNYEMIRTGRTPYGHWDNNPPPGFEREEFFKCQCCQLEVDFDNYRPCYTHHLGIHCIDTKKLKWKYGKFHWHPGIKFMVLDEVHRCGALAGLNYEMLVAAKRQGIKTLALSATPATSPLGLKALGYLLGLHGLADFPRFAREHGCRPDPRFHGWKFFGGKAQQLGYMVGISQDLFPKRGVRVRTADIPGFPARTITAELYDLKEAGRIEQLYAEMALQLAALRERGRGDLSPDAPITKILRAREEIELLKVPVVVELVEDALAKGQSVAVFVNFSSVLAALRAKLHCNCYIDGKQTAKVRADCIDSFQADESHLILANTKAGRESVSLHDLLGDRSRLGLVMPGHSAVDMKQVFGRLPREGGKSAAVYRVILAAGTVETSMHRALAGKLNNLDALVDADLAPDNLSLAA